MATETAHSLPTSEFPTRAAALVLAVEALVLLAYFGVTANAVTQPRYVLYPFVWMNVALYAVWRLSPADPPDWARHLADFAGVGYFLLLAFLGGLLAVFGPDHAHSHIHGLQVTMASPGYGPRVGYVGSWFHVYVVPYRVVGYAALAYLLSAAIRDASAGSLRAVSGALGVVTCIGCAFPLVASLAGSGGVLAGVAATATAYPLDVSTAAFLGAVAALSWRPGGA